MKLPAAAIASAFASGIAIGLWPVVANRARSRGFVFGEAAAALLLMAVAVFLLSRQFLRGATLFSLAIWISATLAHLSRKNLNLRTTFELYRIGPARSTHATSLARNASRRTGSATVGHFLRNRVDQRRLPGAVHFRSGRLAHNSSNVCKRLAL